MTKSITISLHPPVFDTGSPYKLFNNIFIGKSGFLNNLSLTFCGFITNRIFTAVNGINKKKIILTFDIEDWFHTHENRKYYSGHIWDKLPSRVEQNTEIILNLLDKYDRKATFFILGWVAEKHPGLIKTISEKEHEIGAHSTWHHNASLLSIDDFEKDLERNIKSIENITGNKVISYRAPGFSLKLSNKEYFDILTKHGIVFDSSVQLIKTPKSYPITIQTSNSSLTEFPLIKSFFGYPYSGGGYFRVLPLKIIDSYFKNQINNLFYLHPRDIDKNNPKCNLFSGFRNWFNNYNTDTSLAKLEFLLKHYSSTTIANYQSSNTTNEQSE